MPPKKTSSLTKLKSNISTTNSGSDDTSSSKKQVTISKFFATKVLSQQPAGNATDDVVLVIDRSSDNRDNVKEVKVRSPLKKRQRENAEFEETSPKRKRDNTKKDNPSNSTDKEFNLTSSSPSTSKINCCNQKEPVQTKLDGYGGIKKYQVSAETKEKLKAFGASTDFTESVMEVDFDWNSLKRKRAAELPDINEEEKGKQEEKLDASFEIDENEDESKPDSETVATASKQNNSSSANNESKPNSKSFLSQFAAVKPASKGLKKAGTNYTKLELQYLEIKDKYSDAVLFVECGYKYRFFREDAEIAAKVLKIYCHLDHNFMTASIPVHRLFVHVRRLVAAGYKVGVVKQTETAALKAAGDNRNTPFTRELKALYTKSTLIGEDVDPIQGAPDGSIGGIGTNTFLMCVCDSFQDKNSKGQQIGIVAVQPATGEVIYDSFEDGDSKRELETRISHIVPVEVILQNSVSDSTDKLIKGLQTVSSVEDDKMRVEKLEDGIFTYNKAFDIVSEFYGTGSAKGCSTLQEVLNLPKPVICCLSGLITYLRDFNLDKVLRDTSAFTMFSVKSKYMQLDGNTMRNLELFQNDTNGKETGSLFWVLNQTVTKFGARLLRFWLSRPLLSRSEIESRQQCIQELISNAYPGLNKLRETLAKCPDLEKGLCSVYHKKCGPLEFYTVCKSLHQIYVEMKLQKEVLGQQVGSGLLTQIVLETCDLLNDISTFRTGINENAAKENDKTNLFTDESQFPDIGERKWEIQSVMKELQDHLQELKQTLNEPSLEYITVMGIEYQVKVRNTLLKKVPPKWIKITSTKEVSRFHSPFIVEKYKELNQLREQLVLDCNKAWIQYLDTFGENYQRYRKAVQLLSTLDCLFSLASVAKHHGYCRPEINDDVDVSYIQMEQGRHPVIHHLIGEQQQYVPNDTDLHGRKAGCMLYISARYTHQNKSDGKRVMIITGPNMGGKSSYIKQVALISILAQMGSFVPADSAKLSIFDAVYTRMGAADEIFQGRSTFMVELQEASQIMAQATSRSLVILDELGRGTSTHDGVAIAYSVLDFFINKPKCLTLFVTHYPLLAEFEDLYPDHVGNYHMSFFLNEEENNEEVITFLYQLVSGMAARSYGLNVATLANIPTDIVKRATKKSHFLEEKVLNRRRQLDLFRDLVNSQADSAPGIVKKLLECT